MTVSEALTKSIDFHKQTKKKYLLSDVYLLALLYMLEEINKIIAFQESK